MKVKEGIFQSNIASCNHKVAGGGGGGGRGLENAGQLIK